MNNGFDCFGTVLDENESSLLGFDYMALLKGAGGLLSGVSEGLKPGGGSPDMAALEKMRMEEQRRRDEESAKTTKMVLIGLGALLGVGGIVLLVTRK